MRICEVIIFVCLFAKFFCKELPPKKFEDTIEVCYGCKSQIEPSCTIFKCDCNDSPRLRLRVPKDPHNGPDITKDPHNGPVITKDQKKGNPEQVPYRSLDFGNPQDEEYPKIEEENIEDIGNSNSNQSTTATLLKRPNRIPITLNRPRAHCIEAQFMVLVWNVSQNNASSTFYSVRYEPQSHPYHLYESKLTECNFMELSQLVPNMRYRIEVRSYSIYSVGKGVRVEQERSPIVTFRTRDIDEPVQPVKKFYFDKWILQDNRKYTATVRWEKGKDATCFYNLVYFPNDEDYEEIDVDNPLVNNVYNITNLDIGKTYPIAIMPYTMASHEPPLEGKKTWLNLTTPTCFETFQQTEQSAGCTPDKPKILEVEEIPSGGTRIQLFNVNMYWDKPLHIPQYYMAHLILRDANNTEYALNITGDNTNVTFQNIPLTSDYDALLVAYSRRGIKSKPAVIHRQVIANVTLQETDNSTVSVKLVTIIIAVIVFIIFILFLVNRFVSRRMRSQERKDFFRNFEDKKSRPSTITTISTITFGDSNKIDEWEIDTNKLAVKEVLGGGAFGVVRKGWYTDIKGQEIEVAIKMLRDNPCHEEIKQFYQEIEIMKSVPPHPHLVSLIGCVTKQNLLLVVEYCSKGDLQTYLRAASDKIIQANLLNQDNNYEISKYVFNKMYDMNVIDFEDIPEDKDLISIARQVALGMEYLQSLKLIHRDLAARNVLISEDNIVKISDFGLSRDVYYDNIYYKASAGKLPIRWMALESMTHQIYTTQSDVWSFGILLWEIVTLGGTPYPGVQTHEILGMLKDGYRMKKPDKCSEDLYNLMCQCWKAVPQDRPCFTEIRKTLDELLAKYSNYLNLDMMAKCNDEIICR